MTATRTTIADAMRNAAERLRLAGIETSRLDAEVLLRHVLGIDRTQLFLRLREQLPPQRVDQFGALIERRLAREPVAYLVGEKEFMGLPFAVGPGVLVPRPETELLVEWAVQWISARPQAIVVDVGTGSGAIALSLPARRGDRFDGIVIGADVSTEAIRYASLNRDRLELDNRVHLLCGDLTSWCRGPVDLVLANLPYLRPDQIGSNADLRAEPALALDGGADGLDLVRRLLLDAGRVLAADGAIGFEVDPSNAGPAAEFARRALPTALVEIRSDLAGLDRLVTIQLPTK